MIDEQQNRTIPLKCADGFCLPVLGFGTYQMGGETEHDPANDDQLDIAAIQAAVSLGIRHIDTAESYADGYCETLVGRVIKNLDRQQLFITTKVRASNLQYDDVIAAAKRSLERLGIKQIDLYLIHRPNPEVPIAESMRAMDFLLEHELIKHVGVSNFNVEQLTAAMAATKYRIVSNQIHYNLPARSYEQNGTLEFCRTHNVLVTAYRIVGYDQLTAGAKLLDPLAKKYQKTPAQIAINWLTSQPNVVGLVKSTNPGHLQENLGALGWRLTEEDAEYLGRNFPRGETINLN